ncbi:hypothetical protein AJ80_10058 [Polytolypa hystricis UAMH7299]|uniref:Uncharacterized protein n=1 Tax=Polytolypa hystricis (strain UAMH7299) TaxID=1447883 RepID=A0A2B7WEP8_POLH7|nr:hypothetical protein AJ80_10058 [Polytolypa hystricis UAMH7299]
MSHYAQSIPGDRDWEVVGIPDDDQDHIRDPVLPIRLNTNVVETECDGNGEVLPGDGDHNFGRTSRLLAMKADRKVRDSYDPALTQAIRGEYEALAIGLVEREQDL